MRFRAAKGGVSKSPVRSLVVPPSCCSTSPLPASIRSRSPTLRMPFRHLKERGIGVLITDHNVRETLGLVDRAYIIHSGELLTEGTPDEIVNDPNVRRLYLGEDFRL